MWLRCSGAKLKFAPSQRPSSIKKASSQRMLVSQVAEARSANIGAIPGHSEASRLLLLKLGVPDTAIEMFGQANRSTKDEASALRNWADQHHVSRITIP